MSELKNPNIRPTLALLLQLLQLVPVHLLGAAAAAGAGPRLPLVPLGGGGGLRRAALRHAASAAGHTVDITAKGAVFFLPCFRFSLERLFIVGEDPLSPHSDRETLLKTTFLTEPSGHQVHRALVGEGAAEDLWRHGH